MKLNETYKLELAEKLTSLAIENNLITKYSKSEDTAKQVTTFYQTIFSSIDSTEND